MHRFRSAFTFLLAALIIWCFGPYIAIAGHSALESADHRIIVILLLALGWKYRFPRLASKFQSYLLHFKLSIKAKENDSLAQELKSFRQEIKDALTKFAKLQPKKKFLRQKKPGYLVIGPSQCGKSNLLKNHDSTPGEPIASYQFGESWALKNANFIELNTDFLLHNKFQAWLKFIKRFRHLQSFHGCILTLNFTHYFSQSRQQQEAEIEKYRVIIKQIIDQIEHMPVFIVFTQCDLIAGFSEFFASLTAEERTQILGFSFTSFKKNTSFTHIFDVQFTTFLRRLNERVIMAMHQGMPNEKRSRIKDLPLQFELLKPAITELSQQLHTLSGATLSGCYLTSCSRFIEQASVDYLAKPISTAFNLHLLPPPLEVVAIPNKNFFVAELLENVIPMSQSLSESRPLPLIWSLGIYLTITCAVVVSSSYLYHSYRRDLSAINAVQLKLEQAKIIQPATKEVYPYLPKLIMLGYATEQLHQHAFNRQISLTTQNAYQQILTTQFIPTLKNILETSIITTSSRNPDMLYRALKAYLMLSDTAQMDPKFVNAWFTAYWQKTVTNTEVAAQLNKQLTRALQQGIKITPNLSVITTARNVLSQIPLAQLSYSVLLDHYNQPLTLISPNNAIILPADFTIPSLYTAANFNDVYNHQIANACQEVIAGNWVLGKKQAIDKPSKIALTQLVDQVQLLYLNHYAAAWTSLLTAVTIKPIQTLNQAVSTSITMGGADSPLWQLLTNISINTAENPTVPQFSLVSDKFRNLNNFITSANAISLQQNLSALANYLTKINRAKDPLKATFAASAQRVINDGQTDDALETLFQQAPGLPQPLQTWISSMIAADWHVMLTASQTYLNTVWARTIWPEYNVRLNNRYPLFQHASLDISLNDFSEFFAPTGKLISFFNFYLKPFVDTNSVYWVWKKVDKQTLPIPESTLEMFIRASLIEKMFFAEGSNKPLVRFSLIPQSLEPGVDDFNLNLGGQIVNFQPGRGAPSTMVWPTVSSDHVFMRFINSFGQPADSAFQGPWAWFRLLEKANLEKTENPRWFNLTFDLNGNSAKYRLVADQLINPFIPGIIDAFRCPEQL